MDFLSLLAFFFVITLIDLPSTVKKLKRKINKIELKIDRGESSMSNILKELEGKKCKIIFESDFSSKLLCQILDVDEEWIKLLEVNKKGNKTTKIIRVDNIKEINQVM